MLRLRSTYEQLLKETMTHRLKILPEKQKRTQQGILLDDVDFDDFDLNKYNIRNPNKATQTDMFNEPSNYSDATSNRSVKTAIEGNEDRKQERQTSISTGDSLDDLRNRTRMSIADDLATMARVGGNIIYYTGQGIGQGINMAVDAYNWMNEDEADDNEEIQPPIDDDEVSEQIQEIMRRRAISRNGAMRLMRRGASRSRSPEREEREEREAFASRSESEQPSGSNDAMRLMRRGASRSRSETPPSRKPRKK